MVVFRFRKRQDNKVGLSSSAKMARRKQNLVSMQFNMINWLVETVSLFLVMFEDYEFFTILYLLVTSCGAPLVYYLGIEDNRLKAREYFQSRIRIFRNKVAPALDKGDKTQILIIKYLFDHRKRIRQWL